MKLKIQARAKINWTLDVVGVLDNGYHDLDMLMQSVTLCDQMTMEDAEELSLSVRMGGGFVPADENNLVLRAARALQAHTGCQKGARIALRKYIPVAAGMGGGSSDAAAVLRALNQWCGTGLDLMALARIGEQVGSDVPYCVLGGTALAEGRGEVLMPLSPLPRCRVVLCKPDFSVSTPALFAKIDSVRLRCRPDTKGVLTALEQGDLEGVARRLYNVFEDALPQRCAAKVEQVKRVLIQSGALGAVMSGTGSAVYGLFRDEGCAQDAYEQLKQLYPETFLTYTV